MNSNAIAVFDSGVGGLTVLKSITQLLPEENFLYYGDGAYCPYGNKSPEEIINRSDEILRLLISKNIKMFVIACNTASSYATAYLREKYDLPIVAMEPAVKPAVLASKSKKIGVIATRRTIDGDLLKILCNKWNKDVEVITRYGDGLVEIVEAETQQDQKSREIISSHIEGLASCGVDQIVLGCTHYPFLIKEFKEFIGNRDIALVDPAPSIAKRVDSLLTENQLHTLKNGKGTVTFLSSSDDKYTSMLEKRFNTLLNN